MKRIRVRGDSQLVIRQMTGCYEVRREKLVPLNQYANEIEAELRNVTYEWIERCDNTVADSLAGEGQGAHPDYTVALDVYDDPPVRYIQ